MFAFHQLFIVKGVNIDKAKPCKVYAAGQPLAGDHLQFDMAFASASVCGTNSDLMSCNTSGLNCKLRQAYHFLLKKQ